MFIKHDNATSKISLIFKFTFLNKPDDSEKKGFKLIKPPYLKFCSQDLSIKLNLIKWNTIIPANLSKS